MNKNCIYAVALPRDAASAKGAGFRVLVPGWRLSSEALVRPAADFLCDMLCVSGNPKKMPEGFWEALCNTLAGECARVSARAVFLDFETPEEGWRELIPALSARGLAVYAPYRRSGSGGVRWVCEPDGSADGFLSSVSALPETGSVFLRPVRRKTVIPRDGATVKLELNREELEACIKRHSPGVYRSSGMQANYFTLSERDRTLFFMFDNAETLREKAALMTSRGYEDVFVPYADMV